MSSTSSPTHTSRASRLSSMPDALNRGHRSRAKNCPGAALPGFAPAISAQVSRGLWRPAFLSADVFVWSLPRQPDFEAQWCPECRTFAGICEACAPSPLDEAIAVLVADGLSDGEIVEAVLDAIGANALGTATATEIDDAIARCRS